MKTVTDTYIHKLFKRAPGCAGLDVSIKRKWLVLCLSKIQAGLWVDSESYQLLLYGGFVLEKKIMGKYQKRLTLLAEMLIKEHGGDEDKNPEKGL